MGNRLKNSLAIITGASFIPLEAVRDQCAVDHFGCTQVLSSVDGIVSEPWSGACDRMCFILNTTLCPPPFIKSTALPCFSFPRTRMCRSDQCGVCWVFFLWAFAGLPSPGSCLPLGSSDFRWALSWESSYYPPGIKAREWTCSNDSWCWINHSLDKISGNGSFERDPKSLLQLWF